MATFGLTAFPSNEELCVPKQTPRILFFDFATKLGFAFGVAGIKPISGSRYVSKDGTAPKGGGLTNPQKFGNAQKMALEFYEQFKPTAVGWESAFASGAGKGQTTTANVAVEWGLPAVFVAMFYNLGVHTFCDAYPNTIRKHFTGNGKSDKPVVFRKCVSLQWINPATDDDLSYDRSDALAGWSWAEAHLAPKLAQPVDDLLIQSRSRS